jgi:hypothetical protein
MRTVLRYLRIAFSAFCVTACLLLIILWARSYFGMDRLQVPWLGMQTLSFYSFQGKFTFDAAGDPGRSFSWLDTDYRHSFDANVRAWSWDVPKGSGSEALLLPYCLPVLLFATLAAAPWLRWRFSLRTLLVGMTLVAVGLGLIVYVSRK